MQLPAVLPHSSRQTTSPAHGPGSGQLTTTALWLHLLAPVAGLALLLSWAHFGGGDQALADGLYAMQGNNWALRHAWITDKVVHEYGRNLNALAWLALFVAWVIAGIRGAAPSRHRPLGYLLLATLLSCLTVSWIKSWTNVDCPWDLIRYGGSRQFIGLFDLRPLGMPRGRCFPAGHASGGYAWLALYFFFLATAPRWRWAGLSAGAALGLVFGISQQLRGAHFLSHDVVTAGACWIIALALYAAMLRSDRPGIHATGEAS